jgi:septation ring formation regulator
VYARHYVEENHAHIAANLGELSAFTRSTADEARFVQQNYRLSEKEAAIPEAALEQVEGLEKRFGLLTDRINAGQSASSVLGEELKAIDEESRQLLDEQGRFSDRLKELRINETEARSRLSELGKILQETDRKLFKANTPGIPEDMDVRLEEAEEQLFIVSRNLQEMPLNMSLVNESLTKAETYIHEVSQKADEMLENVDLIERLIQYGNRYRSNPAIDEQLAEAEEAFRECRYGKALEDAASAVEAAEPGALKKIEVLVKQEV